MDDLAERLRNWGEVVRMWPERGTQNVTFHGVFDPGRCWTNTNLAPPLTILPPVGPSGIASPPVAETHVPVGHGSTGSERGSGAGTAEADGAGAGVLDTLGAGGGGVFSGHAGGTDGTGALFP